ncbi:MAG: hypothetical protein ABIO83_06660, partial [Ilumatobacteraceae bacterium]
MTTRPFDRHACRLADFVEIVEQCAIQPDFADRLVQRVPVFEAGHLRDVIVDAASQRAVREVMAEVLERGAGILVIAGAFDHTV